MSEYCEGCAEYLKDCDCERPVSTIKRLESELKRVQSKYEQEMQIAEASQKRVEMGRERLERELAELTKNAEQWKLQYCNEWGAKQLVEKDRDHWKAEAERLAKERNEARAQVMEWDRYWQQGLFPEREDYRRFLERISAMAGHPDAAEACRNIIAVVRDALGGGK